MDNKEMYAKGMRALKVLLYMFESEVGRQYKTHIESFNVNYSEKYDTGDLSFEIKFSFTAPDPDLEGLSKVIKQLDSDTWKFFSNYELAENEIKFVKNTGQIEDALCLVMDLKYSFDAEEYNCEVILGFDYNF